MANALMSRFAVLPDDVDDEYSNRKKRVPAKKNDSNKVTVPIKDSNKKKKNKENVQTQSAKAKAKSGSSGNSKKKKEASPEQWEEWKEKDEKLVEGTYIDELTQAILLSKIDYEKKKDVYEQAKTQITETDDKQGRKKNKKQTRVLTVEEFHNLGKPKRLEESPEIDEDDPELLRQVKDNVKKVIAKESVAVQKPPRIPFDEEALCLAQVKDALEKKSFELNEVKEENTKLREELLAVKMRNKKLFQLCAQGEMKDKAQVLMEVDELKKVQEELLAEIKSLHEQLEQERSKVRTVATDQKSKDKYKKRTTSSGEQ